MASVARVSAIKFTRFLISLLVVTMLMVVAAPFLWEMIYPMPYADLIHQYSEQHNLDPFLVAAVIKAESRFRSRATSHKDARGLMQILPSTGEWIAASIGLQGFTPEQLYEPEVSIILGTWYLRDLLRQFDGNLPAALAAYNAGRTTVQGWLDEGCWDGQVGGVADVPYGETRDYIVKVLANYDAYTEVYGREATLATSVIRRAWARLQR